MDSVYDVVRWLHIALGTLALISGGVAITTRKGARPHRRVGIIYVICMTGVAVTALVMATTRPNPFLFSVAMFSAAMALSGWLPARGDNPLTSVK